MLYEMGEKFAVHITFPVGDERVAGLEVVVVTVAPLQLQLVKL
jgi:hypothetical protein